MTDDDAMLADDAGIETNEETTTCKFCGEKNLSWGGHDGGWRLMTVDDKLHTCEEYQPR